MWEVLLEGLSKWQNDKAPQNIQVNDLKEKRVPNMIEILEKEMEDLKNKINYCTGKIDKLIECLSYLKDEYKAIKQHKCDQCNSFTMECQKQSRY